jgi:hypothetical protein
LLGLQQYTARDPVKDLLGKTAVAGYAFIFY